MVQCKRHANKISKTVVKALHADVEFHKADSVVVTTSALSPGAKKTIKLRKYRVEEADRCTLQEWLKAMRTPGTGAFPAE